MSGDRRSAPERWREVAAICASALDLRPDLRAAFLDDGCAGDPDLQRDVESLLAIESDVGTFLETGAGEIAADLLAQESTIDLAARRLGSYVIGERIGSGGMGDVYRARDERLGRDVALKVLPGVFADQVDRVAHFMAEARVLAALNHPNIAIIHGLEEADGVRALVLELVEGRTLADLLARGPLPLEEAVPVGRQIAEALEAAHERGIVHRDLKPSNVVVRPDGTVKVLDFGLAKVLAGDPAMSGSPGAPAREVIGTPAYMSPEQAKGLDADKRSDIWAFGAVLYEMLAGRPAFAGDGPSDTLRAVVSSAVDWSGIPDSTPASVRRLIARCLDRDVRQRLRDIGEARIALNPHAVDDGEDPVADRVSTRRSTRWTRSPAGAALLAGLLAAAFSTGLTWYLMPSASSAVTRFPIALPKGHVFSRGMGRHSVAVSPDGTQVVYSGVPAGLYLRRMSEQDVKAIAGSTEFTRVTAPVFSPDGRSIAFHADGAIRTIAVTGGTPVTLAAVDAPYGITWGSSALLLGQGGNGILRVSPTGNAAETLVRVEAGEEAHGPQFLPDGDHILFTLATGADSDRWDRARIVVQSVASGARTTLLEGASDARYLETGHIVYAHSGIIYAVPFDVRDRRVTGTAVALVDGVSRATGGATGAAHFSVSETGTLVYIAGPAQASGLRETMQLGLIDRRETVQRLPLPAGAYQGLRVSPDGTRIAFTTNDGFEAVVWIYDLSGTSAERRLTFGGNNRFPMWSADGARVAFQSDREGDRAIFWQLADGSGPAERLTTPLQGTAHVPESWSPRGDRLLFSVEKGAGAELWMFARQDRTVEPFGGVRSSTPIGAVFSPDGKWVAYASGDGSGQTIYVQPFPATGAKYQFPAKDRDTPSHPVWSPDGKEIFYNPRPQGLEVVSVTTAPAFAFGRSVPVPRPFWLSPPELPRAYDVTPDGRFLARLSPDEQQPGTGSSPEVQVVLNWFEEVRARLPPGR